MENLYTIAVERNDKGWRNSDKVFISSMLANTYMRKFVARHIYFLRRNKHITINKLVIFNDNDNTNTINLIYTYDDGTHICDEYRVRDLIVYKNENDFEQYPIQF